MRILEEPAGPVPKLLILTPAIFPSSALIGFGVRFTVRSSGFTLVAEYPSPLDLLLIPRAVTNTSSMFLTSVAIEMVMDCLPSTGTSCLRYPMELKIKTSVPEAAMLNLPALSVEVERVVPFTCTVALPMGFLSTSVTVPVMVCEKAATEKNRRGIKKNNLFAGAVSCLKGFLIIAIVCWLIAVVNGKAI